MYKNHIYYWIKQKLNSKVWISRRSIVPLVAVSALVIFGFQPVFSESNNIASQESSTSESPGLIDSPSTEENYLNQIADSSSTEKNSASILDGEVSVQVNNSTRADVSQSDSNISINIKNTSTPDSESPSETTTPPNIVINGEEIAIPDSGRVRQTLRDENSTTRLRTDIDSDGSSSISINSSTN